MCFLKVYTEGRLIVEFNFDDLLRIRSWHFAIRNHRELIPRSVIAMQVSLDMFVAELVAMVVVVVAMATEMVVEVVIGWKGSLIGKQRTWRTW